MSDDKVVPFQRRPPVVDPEVKRLSQLVLILTWTKKMREAGHMPDDVAQAFNDFLEASSSRL